MIPVSFLTDFVTPEYCTTAKTLSHILHNRGMFEPARVIAASNNAVITANIRKGK